MNSGKWRNSETLKRYTSLLFLNPYINPDYFGLQKAWVRIQRAETHGHTPICQPLVYPWATL